MLRGSTLIAPVMGIVLSIATSNVPAAPCVLRDFTPSSVSGAVAEGVTLTVADAALAPVALVAVIEQSYAVPLANPPTAIGAVTPLPVTAPGLQVAV